MISKAKIWLAGMRAPFLVASAIPVLFAGALASLHTFRFDWLALILSLVGIVLIHAAANMTNEYFDFLNKTDVVNKNRTIFSGGSGLLVEGKLTLKEYKIVFSIFYIISFMIGAFLVYKTGPNGWIILTLATFGFLLTYFYSCPPINFAHRGLGELVVGLCFGPLPILGTYLAITKDISITPILASLPIMLLIIAVLWINQFPDTEADSFAGKCNLVLRLGLEKARYGYYFLMLATYAAVLFLILAGYFPWYSIAALVTLPLAYKSSMILHKKFNQPKEIFPAMGMTILNHHLTGLILTGSLLFEKFF